MAYQTYKENTSLKELNTFHIDVKCQLFVTVNSEIDLSQLIHSNLFTRYPHLILGSGSNILFTRDFEGIVVKDNLKGIEIIEENDNDVYIRAAAGEIWHELVRFCVDRSYAGIENLSLIPGTVGAAPIQNIGAYGVELMDVFNSLEAIDLQSGDKKIFHKDDCQFGYRDSIFKRGEKGKYCITAVTLRLSKKPQLHITYGAIKETLQKMGVTNPGIKDVSDAVIMIRKSKLPDPALIGNAGSFFKNPEIRSAEFEKLHAQFPLMPGYPVQDNLVKIPAGWLIEQCGWKGKRIGNTGAHRDQALVLVNYGNATGNEIYSLALEIKKSVMEKFGVEINPEVNVV